jgi:hypothetical protein
MSRPQIFLVQIGTRVTDPESCTHLLILEESDLLLPRLLREVQFPWFVVEAQLAGVLCDAPQAFLGSFAGPSCPP